MPARDCLQRGGRGHPSPPLPPPPWLRPLWEAAEEGGWGQAPPGLAVRACHWLSGARCPCSAEGASLVLAAIHKVLGIDSLTRASSLSRWGWAGGYRASPPAPQRWQVGNSFCRGFLGTGLPLKACVVGSRAAHVSVVAGGLRIFPCCPRAHCYPDPRRLARWKMSWKFYDGESQKGGQRGTREAGKGRPPAPPLSFLLGPPSPRRDLHQPAGQALVGVEAMRQPRTLQPTAAAAPHTRRQGADCRTPARSRSPSPGRWLSFVEPLEGRRPSFLRRRCPWPGRSWPWHRTPRGAPGQAGHASRRSRAGFAARRRRCG